MNEMAYANKIPPQDLSILVINLKKSEERRQYMDNILKPLGIQYEFFNAIDGRHLRTIDQELYDEKRAKKCANCPMTPGEIGCAFSHIRIYEKMVKENIPEMLVLEDDIELDKKFFHVLFQRKKFLPKDWQIFHFHLGGDVILKHGFVVSKIDTKSNFQLLRYTAKFAGAYAYVIKLEAAKYLLKTSYPVRYKADTFYFKYIYKMNIYGMYPNIVYLTDFKSTVAGEPLIEINRSFYIKKFIYLIKHMDAESIHILYTKLMNSIYKRMYFIPKIILQIRMSRQNLARIELP